MPARPIVTGVKAASCYFRTTVDHPHRKALVQICEPCNELCKHCFVNATKRGRYMRLDEIRDRLIPQLAAARVNRVTVTGEVKRAIAADLEREWGWMGFGTETEGDFTVKPLIVASRIVGGDDGASAGPVLCGSVV